MPFPRPPLEAQPRRITLNVDSDMLANFSFPYSPKNKGVGGEGLGGDGGTECILFSGSGRTSGRERARREDGRREKMETKKKKKSDEEEGYSVKVLYSTLVSLLTNKEKVRVRGLERFRRIILMRNTNSLLRFRLTFNNSLKAYSTACLTPANAHSSTSTSL